MLATRSNMCVAVFAAVLLLADNHHHAAAFLAPPPFCSPTTTTRCRSVWLLQSQTTRSIPSQFLERTSSKWERILGRWQNIKQPQERGSDKIILREDKALGGVPRSDRYSSSDWFHNTVTMPNSTILHDIMSPVLAVTSWGTALSLVNLWLQDSFGPAAAARLYFPLAPHSMMMSALGLLLVFRTNSAYQRFAEGREIWEHIVNAARDLYRMLMLYENEIGFDKRRRLQRLLAAFPYLLRHRIRPNLIQHRQDEVDPVNSIMLNQDAGPTDTDTEAANEAQEEERGVSWRKPKKMFWVDKRNLPWRLLPKDALHKCARAQNRPLWVCDRMAQEIRQVPDGLNFSPRERLALIGHVNKLSACVGAAERIHQTVVPLNYARHTLRALTIWLFSFPFAVVGELGLMTGPTLFLVSWLLFGVYEIGIRIEDPFQGALRLSILCDTIRRDVYGDELHRSTAFQLPQPADDDRSVSKKVAKTTTIKLKKDVTRRAKPRDSDAYQ